MSAAYCIVLTWMAASVARGFNIPAFISRAHVASIGQNRAHYQMKMPPGAVLPMSTIDEPSTQLESMYTVGQEYSGIVTRAKGNGIVVNVTADQSVFLPRSKITRGTYERLKSLLHTKSEETVRVEIIAISKNGTLSGKYRLPAGIQLQDANMLGSNEWGGRQLNGTVVAAHDYGLFVELNDFGVEGQVPPAAIPKEMIGGSIRKTFAVGSQVQVYIDSYDPTGRKLALSMAPPGSSGDRAQQADTQQPQKAKRGRPPKGGAKAADTAALNEVQLQELARTPAQRWIQAVVQNVTPFGLFVRPANYDVTGLVRVGRIPKELLALLKQQVDSDRMKSVGEGATAPINAEQSPDPDSGNDGVATLSDAAGESSAIPAGEAQTQPVAGAQRAWSSSKKKPTPSTGTDTSTKSGSGSAPANPHHVDLTTVLSAGDVVRVRVFGLDAEKHQLDLTMLPYRPGEREAQESGRPEASGREGRPGVKDGGFDPEDTLIWWRGDAYLNTAERFKRDMTPAQRLALMEKEAQDVIYESSEVVDGTWRRAFEEDLALDQHDSTSRGRKKLLDEIDAQIGALAGLDGSKIIDMGIHKTSDPLAKVKFGVFMDPEMIPPEWRDQVDFFRVAEEREKSINARLRAGKKGDRLAMENTIREVMRRTAEAQAQGKGTGGGRAGSGSGSGRSRGTRAAADSDVGSEGDDGLAGAVRRWQPRASQAIALPIEEERSLEEATVPRDSELVAAAVPEASEVAESLSDGAAVTSEGD